MGDGSDELSRAAQRRRDRVAARAAAAPSAEAVAAERTAREAWVKANRTREALAEAGWQGRVLTTAAVIVGLLAPVAIAVFVVGADSLLAYFGFAIVSLVSTFAAMAGAERALAAVRTARLRAIGRGLDVDGYLAALGENRRRATVVVRATFARPWPDDARAKARDAVLEWMPSLAEVAWHGAALELRSGALEGTIYLSGGKYSSGGRFFDNRALHGCFLDVMRRVVPRLEAVAPIERLAVAIEGKTEPFDADA